MPRRPSSPASTTLHVGASGYAYKEWKGPFYPADLPAKKFLAYYSERFNAVEINASFYRLPSAATLAEWCAQVADGGSVPATNPRCGFVFTLKAPQKITHFQRLRSAEDSLAEFVAAARQLGEHRGPLLFGLPPNFKKDAPRLRDFLALIPADVRAAFEFRHPSWFDDETFDLLRARNAALCIAETDAEEDDDDPLEVPFQPTADWGYLRLRRANYTPAQLKAWIKRITDPANNWRDAFVFFKHEDTGTAPKFAAKLNTLCAKK